MMLLLADEGLGAGRKRWEVGLARRMVLSLFEFHSSLRFRRRPEVEEEDDELEVELLGEAVKLPAAKKVVPKGSQHPRGKTGLPHCTPNGMGQVCYLCLSVDFPHHSGTTRHR